MKKANKNLLKEVLELKNKRNTIENLKINLKKKLKDSFEKSLLNPTHEISFKKQLISDISSSSSDFSAFFEKRKEKCDIFNEKPAISWKNMNKGRNSFENAKDLPRDKESFNKRKSLKEINKDQYLSNKNTNLLALFEKNAEKNSYYLPNSKRKGDNLKESSEDLNKLRNLELNNTIICLKNSSVNHQENPNFHVNNIKLQKKWRETQDKSIEKVGKIVNQAKKLRNTNEFDKSFYEENGNHSQYTPREFDFYDKNTKKNINKTSNFIDEMKPNILRKKPNSNVSLAEKLKKEILLMNQQDFGEKTYNLHGFNNNLKKNGRKTEENCIYIGTLSSEEDEEKSFHKKHLQRKSLNHGYLETNAMNLKGNLSNNCNKHSNNTVKTFEKKDIEKIYREYKSRKI